MKTSRTSRKCHRKRNPGCRPKFNTHLPYRIQLICDRRILPPGNRRTTRYFRKYLPIQFGKSKNTTQVDAKSLKNGYLNEPKNRPYHQNCSRRHRGLRERRLGGVLRAVEIRGRTFE